MNSSKIYKSIIYQTKETQTGTATILVNEGTGDNVIAIYPGANMTMSSDEITIQKEAIINSDVILLQLETNYTALQQAITLAQKNSIPVIINPAPIMISSTNLFRMLIISPPMKQKLVYCPA